MSATLARMPWWAALGVAAAGGYLLDVALPSLAWWPAVFPGVALVLAAVWQQKSRWGALAGAVAGAAFWLPHISWLTLYLGPVPWLGLGGAMILWFALMGALLALATRGIARIPYLRERPVRLALAQACAAAGLWVLREIVQGAWPYGGFPWGRLAHTQASGPLAQSVSWFGLVGLTGAIALVCAMPIAAMFARSLAVSRARWGRSLVGAIAASAAVVLVLALIPSAKLEQQGTLTIGAVQGNSKSGIFDDRDSGEVLYDHIAATEDLLARTEAAGTQLDVIVWPENSAEFGLPANRSSNSRIAALAKRAGAPIVVGTVLRNADGTYSNSSLVWGADGSTGARYDKRFPVPFAEYMPNRDFFHMLAPDLVDLVQLEYAAGVLPSAYHVDTPAGSVMAGIAICFDIIFDQHADEMVDDGAEVIFAQTNNADFGRTDENAQQLAIARLRAIETGRALVNISTVGTSAIVLPDGSDAARLTPFTSDAMVAEVPLVAGKTPARTVESVLAWLWGALALVGLVLGGLGLRHGRGAVESLG